MIVPKVVHSVL